MAEAPENGKSTKANIQKVDTDLPPPPSQDAVLDPPPAPGSQDSNPLPLPPPKESFSKFYQQRQVNELKRLYRHMHPELRKNLEEAVTEDLAEMLSTDDPAAQASVSLDPVLPGEVQSMRWIFENWTLDSIGDHQGARKLAEEEAIPSGDVKNRSMKFESQSLNGDRPTASGSTSKKEQTKGDVHTARWLFETQPLDSLNKMYLDETDMQEAVLREPVQRGDVKGATQLFETHSLDALGRCSSVEEQSILQLKSEIQELKGDVKKTIKLFQTEPLCAIRDKTGNIHEIKSVCREEIHSNAVRTARWLFETQPLDTINKDMSKVQVIRGISLEEVAKGNVGQAKWLFETQPLDAIREVTVEEADFKALPDLVQGADVTKQCLLFETQPLDMLKGEATDSIPTKEEVIRGDVKSTLWLFETQPMEALKDNFEVGQLKKLELSEEEKGAVKERKHIFETCPLGSIAKSPSEDFSATSIQEVEKGDVKAFKSLFETLPLDSIRQVSTEEVVKEEEEVPRGNVKANQFLFETTPLYAIKDSFGNFHKVTSVSREEEVTGGDVKNCKWMFETKPLDQFDDSIQKVDIIKGITKQEVVAGDVKTAKWLFETQPIDVIHSQINPAEQNASGKGEDSQSGDVKTCRWLFETHPMDALYEKAEKKQDREEPVPQGDVKSYTWIFETQPLDSLRGQDEQYLQVSKTVSQDELQGVDVKTVRHLFETEPLTDNAPDDVNSKKIIRYSSRVEIQSGEVSRVKEFFEAKPLDSAGKPNTAMKETNIPADENIELGAVHKFTWLFENCPMDTLKSSTEGIQEVPPEKDIQSGDVGGKRFIFETYSLGQIHDKENETQLKKIQEETPNKATVESCTMLFETQPLYAIQDRDGGYHEVTSVKKEEIMKGDVKGARWQFETKPLDQIKKDEEVFVIRAVTQEDFKKGDVQAARWRFETEPLDSIAEDKRSVPRTIDDVQRGDVQSNKQLFESEKLSQKKFVRMVSVSDVQQGDVRTSTWLFENQPIDSLKGQPESTSSLNTVQREDIHKGDVKRCTWLFETQPMDSLKDTDTSSSAEPPEVVPQANVKSTTWLFESTPLDKLSTSEPGTETEAKERTIKDTLDVLFSHQVIQHGGILIEANNAESVKMAKYQCSSRGAPEIRKEEVTGGNLERILLQLLRRTNVEAQGSLVEEEEDRNIKIIPVQLLDPSTGEKSKEDLRDNVAKALEGLLSQDTSAKKGIVMQETGMGTVKITIYSLLHRVAHQEHVKGDVKSTIGNLLASSQEQKATATIRREDNERGNVHLFTTCIEKGDLDYLKNLQRESEIESLVSSQAKEEPPKIAREAAVPALPQEENVAETTADVILGDSGGAKQVFLCDSKEGTLEKKVVHAGDLDCTLHCLRQPPSAVVENVVSGNVKLAESGSSRAGNEGKTLGDREEGTGSIKVATQNDEVDGAIQMPAQPKSQDLGGDLQAAMQSLRLATAEAQSLQHQVHSKLQKTTENIHLVAKQPQAAPPQQVAAVQATVHSEGRAASKQHASNVTIVRVQEMSKSHASVSQKNTAPPAKVSASEEVQGGKWPPVDCPDGPAAPSAQISIKDGLYTAQPVKTYVNPFVESDYKEHSVPEEREQEAIIRGDVKTAIRALQSAAAEQRPVEKEEVVRGSLKAALESLEKSNVNVSKGDFKAAMIYRNAGQAYSVCKKKNEAQILREQAAVAASGSQAVNDFPPPPPPASLMRTVCPSTNLREAEALGCPMTEQPSLPKILPPAPAQPSDQRPLEKPPLLPKPEVIPPPRRKPLPPPKPEFLLQEALSSPAGSHKSPSGKVVSPLCPSKSPSMGDQKIPVTSPPNQAQASCGADPRDQSAPRRDSTNCPPPPSPVTTAVEEKSSEGKAMKDTIKTPLQVAEEKYKSRKEEQKNLERDDPQPSPETIKNGLADSERGDDYLTKDIQGFPGSCQPENGCPSPAGQEGVLSFEGQIGPVNVEGQKKPYLSAKCHANVLRKGSIMTHASSSRIESISTYEAHGSRNVQKTSPRTEEAISEAAVSAPVSLPSKQILQGHQCLNSRELGSPSTHTVQHAEMEKPMVVMREKACRETEEERHKRLSVHREEIMTGNVQEAMEIFENLRKQEELQEILTRVKEFEDETSKVDVKALKSFFENVPEWVVHQKAQQTKPPKMDKAEQMKELKEDTDSISSVELAFEDLERASAEIIHLKEQTLSRLLDIEEAIRKALYSISNLKSESDIAGLSGLLQESLGNSQSLAAGNNIRKISIVSSKARQERGIQNSSWGVEKIAEKTEMPKAELEVPLIVPPRASSPSSPSYISIQSAARKPAESPKKVHSSAPNLTDPATERDPFARDIFSSLPRKSVRSDRCNLASCEGEQEHIQMSKGVGLVKQQHLGSLEHLSHQINNNGAKERDSSQSLIKGGVLDYPSKAPLSTLSPSNPRRQKSILELQTSHDGSKLYGATRTVTEQYEEVDEFGNKIITSSTTVTKQSETQTSSTCDMVSCPTSWGITERGARSEFRHLFFQKKSPDKVCVWALREEECGSCAKPVHPEERLAIQKTPLHQSCFYCKYCGKKLSLLNYAVLHGAFYCQAHYKLLAKGGSQEEKTSIRQECRQVKTAVLPSPGLEPKTRNNPTGKILMREKMQPRLCSLHPGDGLRSPKQTRRFASQNKLRISWPPSKEAASPEDTNRKVFKFRTRKTLLEDSALFQHSSPSGFTHKAPGNASIAEKKQRLLPRVTFPNRRDCVSRWLKTEGESKDLEMLEKRVSSMDRKTPGSQARKSQAGLSEKAKMCQFAKGLPWKGSFSSTSPLKSISAKPSEVGSSPFHLKSLQAVQATQSAGTAFILPHGSNLAKASSNISSLSGHSSSKEASDEGNEKEALRNTGALLEARTKLPVLTKLDNGQNRKVPKASKTNTSIALVLEDSKHFGRIGPKVRPEMEDHKPFRTKPETLVYATERKDEESNETKGHINWRSASYPDSLEMRGAPNQVDRDFRVGGNKSPGNVVESTRSESRHGPGKLPCPETLSEEVQKENRMSPEGKPEHFGSLYYTPDQSSQDTKLEAVTSVIEDVAEEEDVPSVFCSQADDSENRDFLPSSDPQNATLPCQLTLCVDDCLAPVMVAKKSEDLPGQPSSEHASHLPSQGDTVEGTIAQASEVKKTETFCSHEAEKWAENQPTGNVNEKSQNKDGSVLQANEGKNITGESAKKLPLKKERNPFARVFASRNQDGSPKKEPARTKNVSRKQSALVTLFGCSSDKDMNKKEQPRKITTQSLMMEEGDEKGLRAQSFSSPPNTEETFQAVIQSRNSETDLLDLGGNYQSCSREEQREISPPVVSTKVFSTKTLPAVPDTDSSRSVEVLPGTMNFDIPKPSAPNKETIPQHDAKSSPFVSFQNSLVTSENMLPSCASSSAETHLITNVASSRELGDKESPILAHLDSQDFRLEAKNVSFSCASREVEACLIDRDDQIPNMLLFSVKDDRLANTQERAPQFAPGLDLGSSQMKDKPGGALSSSDENPLQRSNPYQLSESGPLAATESANNKHTLGTGNSGGFQHTDQQTCFRISAGNPVELGLQDNQATIDSYSSLRDDLPLLLPSLQSIPELLRDAIQGQAGESVAEAERHPKEHGATEQTHESPGSVKLAPDRSPSPTVI